jgi:hypothetical protein
MLIPVCQKSICHFISNTFFGAIRGWYFDLDTIALFNGFKFVMFLVVVTFAYGSGLISYFLENFMRAFMY